MTWSKYRQLHAFFAVRHFQTSSSLKPLGQSMIKAKFYVEPPLEEGTKINRNCPGHMTKMAAAEPINKAKPFNNLFQNQISYNLNIWHGPSGTHSLHILHK